MNLLITFFLTGVIFVLLHLIFHSIKHSILISLCFFVICIFASWIIDSNKFADIEYKSYKVLAYNKYEAWNEWIDATCTDCVSYDSTGSCTQEVTYDCSYEEYHPQYFTKTLETLEEVTTTEYLYNKYSKLWKNKKFIELNRDYYTIDGDMYISNFDNNEANFNLHTEQSYYRNYIKNSEHSIFNNNYLTAQEKKDIANKKIKLFDYPKLNDEHTIDPVLSQVKISNNVNEQFKKLNWKYGLKKEIQIFLLIFNNKPKEYAKYQLATLKGCNKNELFIQVSVKDNILQWYDVASWTDDKALDMHIKEYLYNNLNDTLNYLEIANTIETNIDSWKRKRGRDFKYLENEYNNEYDKLVRITVFIIFFIFIIAILTFKYKTK